MNIQTLVIAVIEKDGAILLRKKPDGSPPYRETWYMFGVELKSEKFEEGLVKSIRKQAGVEVQVSERIGWDTEIKPDKEDRQTLYVYLDCRCNYVSGDLVPGPGIEKLEWVPKERLKEYDLVPPSVKLLRQLGYI